jgi:hypothetical protein
MRGLLIKWWERFVDTHCKDTYMRSHWIIIIAAMCGRIVKVVEVFPVLVLEYIHISSVQYNSDIQIDIT